jgi:hypothetical protein
MTCELCHDVMETIDGFHTRAAPDESIWTCGNILRLLKFAPLKQIPGLRASYMTAKIDGPVFVDPEPTPSTSQKVEEVGQRDVFKWATWKPEGMVEVYKAKQAKPDDTRSWAEAKTVMLNHITNFVAQNSKEGITLKPPSHLGVTMTEDQQALLNPSRKSLYMGAITEDTVGNRAKKRIEKRRIDMFEGNVAAYSKVLKSDGPMKRIKDYNHLAAILADMDADAHDNIEEKATLKKKNDAEKKKKKAEAVEADEKKKKELMPSLSADVTTGLDHFKTLNRERLMLLLPYYYEHPTRSRMKKLDTLNAILEQYGLASEDGSDLK